MPFRIRPVILFTHFTQLQKIWANNIILLFSVGCQDEDEDVVEEGGQLVVEEGGQLVVEGDVALVVHKVSTLCKLYLPEYTIFSIHTC